MPRPYSLDLRERVVAAVAGGVTCREGAGRSDVVVSTVVKWSGRQRAPGSAAPKPMAGRRFGRLDGARDWVLTRIAEKPDVTMRELAAALAERCIVLSHVTVWNLVRHEHRTFKEACRPASRINLTSLGGAPASGICSRDGTCAVSSSSTRRGPKPTWRRSGVGAGAANASTRRYRMVIGRP